MTTWLDTATIEGNLVNVVIAQAIQTARLTRAIDSAPTVVLGVLDPTRELLHSPLWRQASRMVAGGHHYTRVRTQKQGRKFTLTFESTVTYRLKVDRKHRVASPGTTGPLEFIARLCKAVAVDTYIPEMTTAIGGIAIPGTDGADPRASSQDPRVSSKGGFSAGATIKIQDEAATGEQLRSLTTALSYGFDVCRKNGLTQAQAILVMTALVATGTGESNWMNAAHNDVSGGHDGIYQQTSQYYTAPRDVIIATHEFLVGAKSWGPPRRDIAEAGSMIALLSGFTGRTASLGDVIKRRQISDAAGSYYQGFVSEAQDVVAAWQQTVTSQTPQAQQQWSQGTASSAESEYDTIQRIAGQEVFRAFVGPNDKLWVVSDDWLFSRPSAAVLRENQGAVDTIDWTIDDLRRPGLRAPHQKPMDTCSVKAFDTWSVQPGSTVELDDQGPADGKWIVTSWQRDGVKPDSTITLGTPVQRVPDPPNTPTTGRLPADAATGGDTSPHQYPVGTALVQPIPNGPWRAAVIGGIHETDGLPGYPAIDFGAIAGAPVVAVESGTIERFSGHDPRMGPVSGVHGPFGWTIYLRGQSGSDYFITHLGTRTVAVGQRIQAGQQIGTVGDYAKYGGANHTHIGVHPGPSGRPTINDLLAAPRAGAL